MWVARDYTMQLAKVHNVDKMLYKTSDADDKHIFCG